MMWHDAKRVLWMKMINDPNGGTRISLTSGTDLCTAPPFPEVSPPQSCSQFVRNIAVLARFRTPVLCAFWWLRRLLGCWLLDIGHGDELEMSFLPNARQLFLHHLEFLLGQEEFPRAAASETGFGKGTRRSLCRSVWHDFCLPLRLPLRHGAWI